MQQFQYILCWLGVIQSLLLGIYFLTTLGDKERTLLGLMLAAISVRTAKSTLFLFHGELSSFVINVGFAAQIVFAPLLLLYVQRLSRKYFQPSGWELLHFTPALFVVIFTNQLTLNTFWYEGGYGALLSYSIIYLIICWRIVLKHKLNEQKGTMVFMLSFSIFQLSYFTNYVLKVTPYVASPLLNTIFVYAISFLILKHGITFHVVEKRKYKNLNLSKQQIDNYRETISGLLTNTKPFMDAAFTLKKLSATTAIPEHILSFVFSEGFGNNFVYVINEFRITEAKKLLLDQKMNHYSIAGIAAESGFNSLSAFNTAFKKFTGTTPSEFKKRNRLAVAVS
jgi:AraC-like DNA-binding protein